VAAGVRQAHQPDTRRKHCVVDMITCSHCGSQKVNFYRQINKNGNQVVIARCQQCNGNPQPNVAFYKKSLFDLEKLPILEDYRTYAEPCAVCKQQVGTEYHHVAPRYLFGAECENWPGVWLCREHHKEWHDKVTPDMSRRA